ncbi:hypothetical protein GF322_02380 [Candidatus Dependentiae bacterium]|nr:hypothetical protein [Candidatus Dependentiae bacterium]
MKKYLSGSILLIFLVTSVFAQKPVSGKEEVYGEEVYRNVKNFVKDNKTTLVSGVIALGTGVGGGLVGYLYRDNKDKQVKRKKEIKKRVKDLINLAQDQDKKKKLMNDAEQRLSVDSKEKDEKIKDLNQSLGHEEREQLNAEISELSERIVSAEKDLEMAKLLPEEITSEYVIKQIKGDVEKAYTAEMEDLREEIENILGSKK